ncbi:MAG: tetratricopeptide repeat protein, partial [Blastocatellia bacterium]
MLPDKSQVLEAARRYVLQDRLQAAIETYQKIIEADPSDLDTMTILGDLYANMGCVTDAVSQFKTVVDCHLEGGSTRKAIGVLDKILTVDPANIDIRIRLAEVYARAGLPSEARQHYLQIADAYSRRGDVLDALRFYRNVVDLDPYNTSTRIKLGEMYLSEGLNDLAYEAFVIAAEQLESSGEHRRALNAYREARAIRPDAEGALAAVYKLTKVCERTEPNWPPTHVVTSDRLKTNQPVASSVDAPSGSGQLNHEQEDPNSAFVVHEISKAEILVAYGEVNEAVSMLRNALRGLPDNIDIHVKLKDIYLRAGMTAQAAAECLELSRIHRLRGEDSRAREYDERASRLVPPSQHKPDGPGDQKPIRLKEAKPKGDAAPLPPARQPDRMPKAREVPIRPAISQVQPDQITNPVKGLESSPPSIGSPILTEAPLSIVQLNPAPGQNVSPRDALLIA